jgi:hypothetical protein
MAVQSNTNTDSILSSLIGRLPHSLMPSETSYLSRLLAGQALWMPQSEPQWLAFFSRADELFYGGSAGGGKTDLILGMAMECHQRSIIFRREYPQLKDIIERGDDILEPVGISFNSNRGQWRGLPGRRTVEVGAVQYEGDVRKYKGRPKDLYAFDEVPDFSESQVRFLTGWLRSIDPGQRCRVVLAGNPPTTPEGEWIIRYFAPWLDSQHSYPAQPGELRWFAVIEGKDVEVEAGVPFSHNGEMIQPKSRTFIPARLTDNPYLRDSDYGMVLQGLPEPLRSQLLYGDFSIRANDNEWQVIPTAWVDASQERWSSGKRPDLALRCVGVDPSRGGDDETAIAKLYGEWFELTTYPGAQVPDGPTAGRLVLKAMIDDMPAPIFVDVIGIGSSVFDWLKAQEGVEARKVNVAEASKRRDKTGKFGFGNLRSQVIWQFREALDPASGHEIALPPDRQLKVDLCAARYSVNKGGIVVEPKDDIKKRIGRSPDKGEAILLAWHGANRGSFIA